MLDNLEFASSTRVIDPALRGRDLNTISKYITHFFEVGSFTAPDELLYSSMAPKHKANQFKTEIKGDRVKLTYVGFGSEYLPRDYVNLQFPDSVFSVDILSVCNAAVVLPSNARNKKELVLHVELGNRTHYYISLNSQYSDFDSLKVVSAESLKSTKVPRGSKCVQSTRAINTGGQGHNTSP